MHQVDEQVMAQRGFESKLPGRVNRNHGWTEWTQALPGAANAEQDACSRHGGAAGEWYQMAPLWISVAICEHRPRHVRCAVDWCKELEFS